MFFDHLIGYVGRTPYLGHILLCCLAIVCCTAPLQAQSTAGWQAKFAPVGGAFRMFNRSLPVRGQEFEPVVLRLTAQSTDGLAHILTVSCKATDIFDHPVANWDKAFTFTVGTDKKPVTQDVTIEQMGYFRINVIITEGDVVKKLMTDVGIIPPSHPGIRKDSFFASNTSGLRSDAELEMLQAVGMKVQRAHFQPDIANPDRLWASKPATGEAQPLNFTRNDAAFKASKAHGVWVLPIAGYALSGDAKTENAKKTGMHGPPRDNDEFVNTWAEIIKHYPEIDTYEFWNEPWIFGWTWCDTPGNYRKLQTQWCKMALKINPKLNIIAGNSSMFTEDNIEPDKSSWKNLIVGTTHHPYGWGTGQASWREADQFRSQDYGMLVTKRMGLKKYYLTEGGTEYRTPPPAALTDATAQMKDVDTKLAALPDTPENAAARQPLTAQKTALAAQISAINALTPLVQNNLENANKIVAYNVRQALCGGYQGNAQWGIGYGADWTKPNVAYATMTSMLEDRPIVAEIWPAHELITGAIFANPSQVTPEVKALPRADELSVRWSVPIPEDRAGDITKVAVLWSLTGNSVNNLDQTGTITITRAPDLRAFDISGREILPKGATLTVPLTASPVYITSDKLSVVELRQQIAGAGIDKITPVNMYAQSLAQPANLPQTLTVRIENQMNTDISGSLILKIGGKDAGTTPFVIDSGKLADVAVAWPGVELSANNQYGITLTAETATVVATKTPQLASVQARKLTIVTATQLIQAASFNKRTIKMDGTLDSWKGITPVILDSSVIARGFDLTQYLLNPGMEKPTGTAANQRIVARVYTAYDDKNVYLATAVNEDSFKCSAGQPVIKGRGETKIELPYKEGMPGGLNYVINCGDVFQFSFGFCDHVPGYGRQMDDPWAWKGMFYDTDYCYVAHTSTEGDQLIRLWGDNTERRNGYQTEDVPNMGPLKDGKIKITRNEDAKLTLYEIAIPRTELKLFNPTAGKCRFAFRLYNSEHLGSSNCLSWAESAGVFDYWRNMGSMPPTWMQALPCQTEFGIEK
ncbi:MAG: hypothetical protein WCO98_03705 [bacterium]